MANQATSTAPDTKSLDSWFEPWRRRVPRITLSLFLGLVAGVVAYLETKLMSVLGKSLAPPDDLLLHQDSSFEKLKYFATEIGIRFPIFVVTTYLLLRIVRLIIETWRARDAAVIGQERRNALEELLFEHLARKDESFFAQRAPAEIINRLSIDVQRCVGRGVVVVQRRQAVFIIIGKLVVFFHEGSIALAVTAAVTTLLGAYITLRSSRRVAETDHALLVEEDRSRARFEDLLRTVSEAHNERDYADIRHRLRTAQEQRKATSIAAQNENGQVLTVSSFTFVVTFGVLCFVLILSKGDVVHRAAMLAVLVSALPDLYAQAGVIVTTRASLELAETSRRRLMEYDSALEMMVETEPDSTEPASERGLVLDRVTYRHAHASGGSGGGVIDVDAHVPPDTWLSIVGGSGSGKSTLLALLAGRLRPQVGKISLHGRLIDKLPLEQRGRAIALMPQVPVLMDSTIEANLFLPRPSEDLEEEELSIIEDTGLGALCRTKALGIYPRHLSKSALLERIVELRPVVREALTNAGIKFAAFEDAKNTDPASWKLEELFAARADRKTATERLLSPRAALVLDRLATSKFGKDLAIKAKSVISESQLLLELPTYAQYSRLSPDPVDEAIWSVRARIAKSPKGATTVGGTRDLLIAALTARCSELASTTREEDPELRELLGETLVSLSMDAVNPHLRLRENLVFGRIDSPNARAEAHANAVILSALSASGLERELVLIGLSAPVGRGGAHLSAGQRQLVALARMFLRRAEVLVLDEPASFLDAANRRGLVKLLRKWSKEHIVVTAGHDKELVESADQTIMLDGGRVSESVSP